MRIILSFFLLFSSLISASAQKDQNNTHKNPGIEKKINNNWTFNYFPEQKSGLPGFEMPAFDDSKWQYISIPHTWQTYETTKELHPYIRCASADDDPYWWKGWGCYRKHIVISNEYQDKRIYLEFDGVQKYTKIYLNGKYLGDHKGGYTSFYMDATEAVNFGKDNVIAVAVNNLLKDDYSIPPMNAGNFGVYGGIHRDVRLVIKDQLNIPFQGSYKHEGGTFITTPKVTGKEAEIQIKTYIQNHYKTVKKVRLVTHLTDSAGLVIERIETSLDIQPGQLTEFVQKSQTVVNPRLWSPENPYLYKAFSEVMRVTDWQIAVQQPLEFVIFHGTMRLIV